MAGPLEERCIGKLRFWGKPKKIKNQEDARSCFGRGTANDHSMGGGGPRGGKGDWTDLFRNKSQRRGKEERKETLESWGGKGKEDFCGKEVGKKTGLSQQRDGLEVHASHRLRKKKNSSSHGAQRVKSQKYK